MTMSSQYCTSPPQSPYLTSWSKCKFPFGTFHLHPFLISQQFLVHLAILLVILCASGHPSGHWKVLCLNSSHRSIEWQTARLSTHSVVESAKHQSDSLHSPPHPNDPPIKWTEQTKVPIHSRHLVTPLILVAPSPNTFVVSLPFVNSSASLPFTQLELSLSVKPDNLNVNQSTQPHDFISPHLILAYHRLVEDHDDHITEVHLSQGHLPAQLNMTAFTGALLGDGSVPDNISSDSSDVCHFFTARIVSLNDELVGKFGAKTVGDVHEPDQPNGIGPSTASSSSSTSSAATFSLCSHGRLNGIITIPSYGHLLVEPHTDNCLVKRRPTKSELPQHWTNHEARVVQSCEHRVSLMPFATGHQPKGLRSNRVKRFISRERTIEILVVNDRSMLLYHKNKEELQTYVNTLMASVWHIFKHSSIGNEINIKLLESHILDDPHLEKDLFDRSAQKTLRRFCNWQHEYHRSTGLQHDIAILLTRRDLCRKNNDVHMSSQSCDTIGLAHSSQICDPKSSCAIVEDTGLSAAFTIAHELGHVLGIPHDDEEKCKNYYANEGLHNHKLTESNVMARMIDVKSHMWSWSPCSKHFITEYLDSPKGDCLLDHSTMATERHHSGQHHQRSSFEFVEQRKAQAGISYDVNKQCQLMFGDQYKVCTHMPVCKRLWCTQSEQGCRTQHMPWADGTNCGPDLWCQQGECIRIDREAMRPLNGGWGHWSSYSECSLPCGGGIRRSKRKCDNPSPRNGGKFCLGERIRYESCNTEPCDRDFRAEQCAKFNGQSFKIVNVEKNVVWVPHHTRNPLDECKLYCADSRNGNYYQLKDRVDDGTPCSPDSYDKCVNGRCLSAGCDRVLGSNATLDRCGVCRGNNSNCREVEGQFRAHEVRHGYNMVVEIPAGASNIEVNKTESADDWLAIRADDYSYLLNGQFIVNKYQRKWHYGGATIEYSGINKSPINGIERINSTRPISRSLYIEVLCVGNLVVPRIEYRYVLATDTRYEWFPDKGKWTECNKVCLGQHQQKYICTGVRGVNRSQVHDEFCRNLSPPPIKVKVCNDHCELAWHTVPSSQCSVQCGQGYRSLSVRCNQLFRDRQLDRPLYIDDRYCDDITPKPQAKETCKGTDCPEWRYTSEWNQCLLPHGKICGLGNQTRIVRCIKAESFVNAEECKKLPVPQLSQTCSVDCPDWDVGIWSECSMSCGIGEMSRTVRCLRGNVKEHDEFCQRVVGPKPEERSRCNQPECPQSLSSNSNLPMAEELSDYNSLTRRMPAIWHTGKWSECNIIKQLNITLISQVPQCFNSIWERNSFLEKFSDLNEIISTKNYSLLKSYFKLDDSALLRRRIVACVTDLNNQNVLSDDKCRSSPRPVSEDYCPVFDNIQLPGFTILYCKPKPIAMPNSNHEQQDSGPRPIDSSPAVASQSSVTSFSNERIEWGVGNWGHCSCNTSLRTYTHQRLVQCVRHLPAQSFEVIKDDYCLRLLDLSKPIHLEQCIPIEKQSTDSDCSGVVPVNVYARQIDSSMTVTSKPITSLSPLQASSITLATTSTPYQHTATTSLSYASEGPLPSTVRQTVSPSSSSMLSSEAIITTSYQSMPESEAHYSKPLSMNVKSEVMFDSTGMSSPTPTLEASSAFSTLVTTSSSHHSQSPWRWAEWSKCSFMNGANCGNGTQTREAFCPDGYRCNQTPKPKVQVQSCSEQCNPPPTFYWHYTAWSPCICGKGVRTRSVECRDWTGGVLGSVYCERPEPASSEKCQPKECKEFKWHTANWAECSQSCGPGVQVRAVTCHRINSYGHLDPRPLPDPSAQPTLNRHRRGKNRQREERPRRHSTHSRASSSNHSRSPRGSKHQIRHRKRHNNEANYNYNQQSSRTTVGRQSQSNWCNVRDRPTDRKYCSLGACLTANMTDSFVWRTMPWSNCNMRCGNGRQQRKVSCASIRTGHLVNAQYCDNKLKPKRNQPCLLRECNGNSCEDLRDRGMDKDGEYDITVQGATIRVYCYGMSSQPAVDYLILNSDENYSQLVYKPRNCTSTNANSERSSTLYFKYVRLNVTSLQIITSDTMFAKMEDSLSQSITQPYQDRDLVINEQSLGFGQALVQNCADNDRNSIMCDHLNDIEWTSQAMFSINLQKTGLSVALDNNWQSVGPDAMVDKHIKISKNGEKVMGYCGVKSATQVHPSRRTSSCRIGCQPSEATIQLLVP